MKANLAWTKKNWNSEIDNKEEENNRQVHELRLEISKACRNNKPQWEIDALNRKILSCEGMTQWAITNITRACEQRKEELNKELIFIQECKEWMKIYPAKLRTMQSQARRDLRKIEKLRELELNELFDVTEDPEVDLEEQDGPTDLNEAIAIALANHAVPKSPADCPPLEGYGDSAESPRSEKNFGIILNLLAIRGIEAVQVSSHRGTPTDRLPDKPREVGVFAGCLLERAGTRLSQLASFSRGFNCSSGNAYPLADNAIMGIRAIEQFRVRAAGCSQEESSARLASRAGGLRGVVGSGSTGYVCGKSPPSSKPGS
jgi:hypothetical protein